MNIKHLICVVGIICAIGCAKPNRGPIVPQVPTSPSFVDVIPKMKRSIVPIVCFRIVKERAELVSVEGSGFFVAQDGTFITANHVIAGIVDQQRLTPCPSSGIYLPESGNWNTETHTFAAQFYGFSPSDCRRDPD